MNFSFDNTYANELEGFYESCAAADAPAPQLIKLNRALCDELGLDSVALDSEHGAKFFAGNAIPEGAHPLAQVYAGHQFGGFSPRLGDGRALLIGEVIDASGHRRDIQLKGSGATPYSRGGDGKATLSSVLREYLIAEAMHALRIPTTRAAAVVTTGEKVRRETEVPGAVLTRVAASHIRVGTFQYFAARGENANVQRLADYVIARHYPDLKDADSPYLGLLTRVKERQASLIAKWMNVGFIHGVMNTDNVTVSGETIDFGPCAFMDRYDPATVFSSIDRRGRYAYGNQPVIGQWNLARFAETILPLIDEDNDRAVELAMEVINGFPECYEAAWLSGAREKLGFLTAEDDDANLVNEFLNILQAGDIDFTQAHRLLAETAADASSGKAGPRVLFADTSLYDRWEARWTERVGREEAPAADRATAMRLVNPVFIPRNHKVEEALKAASEEADFGPFDTLSELLSTPFTDREGFAEYEQPAPKSSERYRTFCGT